MTIPARISIITIGVAGVRAVAFYESLGSEVCSNPSFPIGPDGRITIP